MNKYTRLVLSRIKKLGFVPASRWLSKGVRALSSFFHRLQFLIEWGVDNPEYFDHQMDIHWQWGKTGASFPMERGVHSSLALKGSGDTLDLCCGDGFYSNYFYAIHSNSVTAIDFDRDAIKWAKRNSFAKNIRFVVGDIRNDIPDGPFDNIVWDAAVEHFTEIEIKSLMSRIKSVLKPEGILSGYTIVEPDHGGKHLHQHEYEFHDKEDLARFFSPHFKNVQVYETVYPTRTNLYFYATDGNLPVETGKFLTIRS